jgi:protein-tyrosine phosphatase
MPVADGGGVPVLEGRGRMDDVSPPLRVTAVCSGNICRSPIAEYVLRAAVKEAGLSHAIVVDSAGVGAWHVGDGADRRSVAVLAKHGYDGSAHRVQQVTSSWFDGDDAPDLLLAMDSSHYAALRRMAPGADVRMMRSFDRRVAAIPGADLNVPDPYYGGSNGFEDVLAMIERATPGVLTYLTAQL